MATTIPATFLALLQADATLVALATGGIVGLHASGAAPITTTTAPSAFVTDGTNGQVKVTITDANTSAFTTGDKRFEIQLAKSGAKHTIADGVIQFIDTQL